VSDIDPAYRGMECWGDKFFFTSKGEKIPGPVPPTDGLVWWDADLLREIHSRGRVYKWKGPVLTEEIEGLHMLWGDIVGDWREEIVTFINGEVRIYSTIIPAADRRVTLMQDPLYRIDVGLIVQGYPHVPVTSFYLGTR
jgi:rhamnogalacturonan endolyase